MTRNSRSKSRSKSKEIDSKIRTKHGTNNDFNGSINDSAADCDLSNDLSKKRSALACSSSDQDYGNNGPPLKKRHVIDISTNRTKAHKRPNDSFDNDARMKLPRREDIINRTWTKISNTQSLNSNSDYIDRNFVVASYNIAPMSDLCDDRSDNFNLHHAILMDELTFINADILCLQHIGVLYWEVLEKSLRECGFRGNVIFNDNETNIGVATLYRTNKFTQMSIESGKLNELCLKIIPHDNGLDETTMSTVKQYLNESESYIITVLQDRKHNRLLIVGNTKLSGDRSDKPDLKCVQAVGLFWRIHDKIGQIKIDQKNNNGEMSLPSWILCGDFNGPVDSPVYQICHDGYPNDSSIEKLQSVKTVAVGSINQSLVDLIWHSFQHPCQDSSNSYNEWSGTTSSDHIWMSQGALQTEKILLRSLDCGKQAVADSCVSVSCPGAEGLGHLSLACNLAFMT